MSSAQSFLLFCSGIDKTILEKCPSDTNKYIGIGATVLFTGILAFFSSAYALYTVFDSWMAAIVFGLIWGLMIFNLDRYIVSSMKSKGSFFRDLTVAFPRLLMAVLLALVISKPLELKIFEKEIDAELLIMEQEVFKDQEDTIKARFAGQIQDYRQQIRLLKQENDTKKALRDSLALMAVQEADGTGGSKQRNLGPIYRAKKQDADRAQLEFEETSATNLPLIAQYENVIRSLEDEIKTDIASLNRSSYGGLAARMEALERLTQKSEAIYWANIFIILLFISVETAPIFVKLISYRSPYDFLLHEHEHVFQMANLERTTLLANSVKNQLKFDAEVGVYRVDAQIVAEKQLIDEALQQRIVALKNKSITWEEAMRRKSILE